MDPATSLCLGCRRTLEEIAGWKDFSAAEKRALLARLTTRKSGLRTTLREAVPQTDES
jgi:predicted Fe-S protein YdhL (DUF1289 family)